MNLADAKRQALILMREWTIDGMPISDADNADYLWAMDDLASIAQTEIARRRKIPAMHILPKTGGAVYANLRTFDMPADFFEFRRVEYFADNYPVDPWAERYFRWITKTRIGVLPEALVGNWHIYYYRYPTPIVVNLQNEKANNAYEFEVDQDVQYLIPFFLAAQLLMDENVGLAITKLNEYQAKLDGLFTEADPVIPGIVRNPSGW